jgi:lipopolysaccharide transport system ATP-binding protein
MVMTSNQNVISLTNISKSYNLYQKPSDRVKETFHPFRKKYCTPFHALRDISVDIGFGETVGIVGRNGCGKSTLLQIVCGIMPPTFGQLTVNGRISAILELGAGFNPEFTGRDNVFLNCSILGMEKATVEERMESILEFADIGAFIDQPVKTYSSGMTMRLAFSIAISVDPAILVVDEALAVGDAAFQRKCYSRLKSLQEQGTTILFVSHDAGAVVELCNRAMLLEQGQLLYTGDPKKVISLYHKLLFAPAKKVSSVKQQVLEEITKLTSPQETMSSIDGSQPLSLKKGREANTPYLNKNLVPKSTIWYEPNGAKIEKPRIVTEDGEEVNVLVRNEEYYFAYNLTFTHHVFNIRPGLSIKTVRGFDLGGYGRCAIPDLPQHIEPGTTAEVRLRFKCTLLPGTYFFNAGVVGIVGSEEVYLHRGIDVLMFEVSAEEHIGATGFVDFAISPQLIIHTTEML